MRKHITLIALNILQVLDEYRLAKLCCANLGARILAKHIIEQILDKRLLVDVKCHYTIAL